MQTKPRPTLRAAVTALALTLLLGCSKPEPSAAADGFSAAAPAAMIVAESAAPTTPGGGQDSDASTLAYEHNVQISLPADDIAARVKALQQACVTKTFGECVVLQVRQQGGDHPDAALSVRIAPKGVEPMIAQAGQGAEIGSRSTQAEDLAVVVRDNDLAQQRLSNERERLSAFLQRTDLGVADMIALSKQLAETDAQLQAAAQEGAQHRRRIDTQLLTMNFSPPDGQAGRSEIGQALRDFGGTLSTGTAWTIRALAFLIPLVITLLVVVAVIRRVRRRR